MKAKDDEAMELLLGRLLQVGVLVSGVIVAAGGIFLFLAHRGWIPDFTVFRGSRPPLRSVAGILAEAIALRPDAVVQAGLLALIVTPILRVAFSLFGFARERDWLYVALTLLVLCVLTVGLAGGIPW